MEHPEKLEVVRKLHFTAPTPSYKRLTNLPTVLFLLFRPVTCPKSPSDMLMTLRARGRKKKKNITFSDLIIDCLQHWDKNIIMDESRDGKCHGANVV